ncbi:MAG: SUMF1/EgtB/PvdO family nonheme iron enzyme, partial [Verrucomicrobia bacterium]|nr:SUMF1/EgtB/PvdO family nonheme iron enzyme [Verrucomicrobiota bacterium]
MKEKSINKWVHGIILGIAATALVLLAGCNNSAQTTVQTESVVESISTPKIKEEKNLTIPLSEKVSLDMIWIEPDSFMMGSPVGELGRDDGETQHRVTLTKGYWLGKYEVTQEQYKAIMGNNPSKFVGDNLPVEQVSWDDAMEFCRKLTDR